MAHIRQEDADLHNTGEVRAGSLQHGAHVLDAELGHLSDAGAGRGQDLAVGLAGDLAGDVDAVGGGDGLGLFGWDGLLVGQVLFGIWELEGGLEAREGEIYVWTCGCMESGGCQSRNPFGIHGTQKRKRKTGSIGKSNTYEEQHP